MRLMLGADTEARAVALAGDILSVVSPRAFAPGAPVELAADIVPAWLPLSGRAVGSHRRGDGLFDVRVRLISLRREHRAALERALRIE